MNLFTVMYEEKGVGVVVEEECQYHHLFVAYKFDNNGGLFKVTSTTESREAIRAICDYPPLYDSTGAVVRSGRLIQSALIAPGFRIIHANTFAVGFAIHLPKVNCQWEVYVYGEKGPAFIGKVTEPADIPAILKNEKLMTGDGKEV